MGGPVTFPPNAHVKALSELCSDHLPALADTRSGGWEIACDHLRILTDGRCHFSADRPANGNYKGSRLHIGFVEVQYFAYDWNSACQTWTTRGTDQNLIIHIPLVGDFVADQAHQAVTVRPGEILLVGSPGDIKRRWHGPCRLLNVVISPHALNQVLAVEFGLGMIGPVRFDPLTVVAADRIPTFLSFVELIISDITSRRAIFRDPILARQIETTLLQIIVKSLPHSHREAVDDRCRTIAPFYVRRAEDYIAEHLKEDLSIGTIAAAAGVSVRTIFYGFKQYRRLTPMKYIRWLRLREAREDLLRARVNPRKIAEIAGSYGYGSTSQFSRDYKNLFGESPQVTLRRPETSATALVPANM